MLRFLDIILSIGGIILAFPLMAPLILYLIFATGSAIFTQIRVGRECRPFRIYKLRTMLPQSPSVPTHCIDPAAVTSLGRFLRKYKLDEVPQLINVIKGDMSLVGPRPCLPTQRAVIEQRIQLGVFRSRPGITGLAQIMGVDMSTPAELSKLDAEMLDRLSVGEYVRLLVGTISGRAFCDRVLALPSHVKEAVFASSAGQSGETSP